ncbi:MAG: hypothetical protein R3B70_47015 [Polyangiaceae bacterium]
MTDPIVEEALLLVDRIDPRLRGTLVGASTEELARLDCDAGLDVPPDYLGFFERLGGNCDAIFGDIFRISVAGAIQFYHANFLGSQPSTSSRFLFLGTVAVGEPFPQKVFLQAHEPGQFYYGEFEGPRPVVRTHGHPEEDSAPFFPSLKELIVYQTWRFHRVRAYEHVGHIEVGIEEPASIDVLLRACASVGLTDTKLTEYCLCLEGEGLSVGVHRRSAVVPERMTVIAGALDPKKRAHLFELLRDNLPCSRPYLGNVPCR